MTDGTFEKVHHSDNPMYGPQKLLLCGFSVASQPKFRAVLETAGLGGIDLVWANEDNAQETLSALLDLPGGSGAERGSTLPRAVIVAGIMEKQLHSLMTLCRKSGLQQLLWAALTPTSETWPLDQLLNELQAERNALAKRKQK